MSKTSNLTYCTTVYMPHVVINKLFIKMRACLHGFDICGCECTVGGEDLFKTEVPDYMVDGRGRRVPVMGLRCDKSSIKRIADAANELHDLFPW